VKEKNNNRETASVRVDRSILNKVREYHKKSFLPIGRFYDMAVEEKLKKFNKKIKNEY